MEFDNFDSRSWKVMEFDWVNMYAAELLPTVLDCPTYMRGYTLNYGMIYIYYCR